MMKRGECIYCDSTGWVDEKNPENPWAGVSARFDATNAGPGIPCRHCNIPVGNEPPRMPPGTTEESLNE